MKKLIKGIVDFRNKVRPNYREAFAKLALGQSPDALLIACSDSRVAPNVFASTEPGDLFVIRNAANIIAPCGADGLSLSDESEAAAIEFALLALNVSDIIVCGHSECGAMRAITEGKVNPLAPHLHAWLRHAEAAMIEAKSNTTMAKTLPLHNRVSQFNVLHQLQHLRTYPLVRERIDSGRLRLHGWWFDIAEAEVLCYDDELKEFVIIDDTEATRLYRRLGNR